jgi:hypothetical protein
MEVLRGCERVIRLNEPKFGSWDAACRARPHVVHPTTQLNHWVLGKHNSIVQKLGVCDTWRRRQALSKCWA